MFDPIHITQRTANRAGRKPEIQKENNMGENHNDIGAELAALKVKITSDPVFEEAMFGLMNHIFRDLTMR
jgi:hypothetical protein